MIQQNRMKSMDAIVAKKIGYGILDHYIIYMGYHDRTHWFMANSMKEGVRYYSEDEVVTLLNEFKPVKIRRFTGDNHQRNLALQRAVSSEGKSYSLVGNNCEHFANYVQNGIKSSPQVGDWLYTLFIAVIVGISIKSNN